MSFRVWKYLLGSAERVLRGRANISNDYIYYNCHAVIQSGLECVGSHTQEIVHERGDLFAVIGFQQVEMAVLDQPVQVLDTLLLWLAAALLPLVPIHVIQLFLVTLLLLLFFGFCRFGTLELIDQQLGIVSSLDEYNRPLILHRQVQLSQRVLTAPLEQHHRLALHARGTRNLLGQLYLELRRVAV